MNPDFIIAGAMRAGTTALAAALGNHSDITITTPKEPNYFATLFGALDYCGPGDKWFASQNVADWGKYKSLFDKREGVMAEASAMYLALPETARAIAGRVPGCKIVITLRDPLERALSAHSYLRSKGREPVADFTRALALEPERRKRGYGPMWWYFGASDYAPGLSAYLDAFGPDRVHILLNEDLKADPRATLDHLYSFLGVRSLPGPAEYLLSSIVNPGGVPRSRTLTRILYPPDTLRHTLRKLTPESARRVVRAARQSSVATNSPRDAVLDENLTRRFEILAKATEHVLGRRLSEDWQCLGASR